MLCCVVVVVVVIDNKIYFENITCFYNFLHLKCRGGSDFPEFSNQFSFPSHDDSQNEKMTDTPSLFPHKKITKTV
jgi:hypothetical protein